VNIEISDAAQDDLVAGYEFYKRQLPEVGDYFLDSLFADIDSLILFGGIHPVVRGYNRLLTKRFPFAVKVRPEQVNFCETKSSDKKGIEKAILTCF